MVVDQRGAGLRRFEGADRVRAGLVVDLDQFGRILGLFQRLGDHQRHRIADVANAALGQHWPGRLGPGRAVAVGDGNEAGQVAVAGGLHVLAGQDEEDARSLFRGGRVDPLDVRMGVG